MSVPTYEAARRKILDACRHWTKPNPAAHVVTLHPTGRDHSFDRVRTEHWYSETSGQRWAFIALCDGHGGAETAEYSLHQIRRLAERLLRLIHRSLGGRVTRENMEEANREINKLLHHSTHALDKSIKETVQNLCPDDVRQLSADDARALTADHREVFERAVQGTTLALAIINEDAKLMWTVGLGDTSIALSTVDTSTGVPVRGRAVTIPAPHLLSDRVEYSRLLWTSSKDASRVLDDNRRILGWLGLARSIGDFPLKLPGDYVDKVFQYIPGPSGERCKQLVGRVPHKPSYVLASAAVRLVDLDPIWDQQPTLVLFTNGLHALINPRLPAADDNGSHIPLDPLDVIPALLPLSEPPDPEQAGAWAEAKANAQVRAEAALGHAIESNWGGKRANMALDVLGNLLGGKDPGKLEAALGRARLQAEAAVNPASGDGDVTIMVVPLGAWAQHMET
ncbi:hypothetical protein C8Q77DRAFT_1071742 [Trametes polyzona]|nr:hypothetical protein C8Q77DRAFT_1071742 [Trametes polyzona]